MIGFVQSLSDNNNNPLTVDSCVDILTLGYTAKVTGCCLLYTSDAADD